MLWFRPKPYRSVVKTILNVGPKRKIWVDADASPAAIKEILYRAAERTKTPVTLVANQLLLVPRSSFISAVKVASGFDVADNYIVEHANKGDIVITQDIPLAAELVAKGCAVLNPRGERYTKENVDEHFLNFIGVGKLTLVRLGRRKLIIDITSPINFN